MSGYGDIIYSRLTTYASLSSLANRVYPGKVPQGETPPYVEFSTISRTREGETARLYRRRVQFNVWATTYDQATILANALESALENHKAFQASPPHLMGSEFINQIEVYDDETRYFGVLTDFYMMFFE